jgi:hypothetical protein
MVKHRFGRSNWPVEIEWEAGGPGQHFYRMAHEHVSMWLNVSTALVGEEE